jgi:two-component system, OmpR family, sensor histidine kinase ArlS
LKITTKINLMTTAWLMCILIAINAVVLFSFMKITVNMEQETVLQKADSIIKEINVLDTPLQTKDKMNPFLTNHSFIRIVQPGPKILSQVANDKHLAEIGAKYSEKVSTQRRVMHEKEGEEQVLIVRVPIHDKQKVTGTLEIGERLLGLEVRKDILISILITCTVLAAILSLFGGVFLSNIIIRPITNMVKTMEDIEQSGIPQKIVMQNKTKDDLQNMADTFNRMIMRLEDNIEKQKQFISDASHEIKTPLTVIKSYANLLRRRGMQNKEITDEAIDSILSEATRIQKMTENFLDLANTENENALDIKQVHITALCQSILKQLKGAYKREILLHYNDSQTIILADELKIKQVIIILLDNAIKYSTEKIDVFIEGYEEHAVIRVRDTGIGIPADELKKIFERFYRVDKARSRETGGTGLGLAIAKNIVIQHKGEINISSEEGKGTEVEVILPLIYPADPKQES